MNVGILKMRINYFILFFLILLAPVCLSAQTLSNNLMDFIHGNCLHFSRISAVSNSVETLTGSNQEQKINSVAGLDINVILHVWNNTMEFFFYFIALTALVYIFHLISTNRINPYQSGEHELDGHERARNLNSRISQFLYGFSPKFNPQFSGNKASSIDNFDFSLQVPKEIYRNEKTDIQDSWNSRRLKYTMKPISGDNDLISEKSRQKELLLIVDNQLDFRNYLISKITNYRIISCSNGREALELAKKHLPDLILANVSIPVIDGFQLCDEIKNNNITSHIIVILLSEKLRSEQKLKEYKHSADAFVEIPFSMNLLLLQINNLLKTRRKLKTRFVFNSVESINYDVLIEMDKQFLDKVKKIVKNNLRSNELSVETISQEIGMSRSQFYRKFKNITDITPKEYITIARLEKSVELLSTLQYTVNEVAFKTGFYDGSHFGTVFKMQFGITPKRFIEQLTTERKRNTTQLVPC
jgi:AraC-like DNA-binding protein/CheY-like chemotaxis protein